MRIFGKKEEDKNTKKEQFATDMQRKLNVEILGKGEKNVPVTKETTVGELRNMLSLDTTVQALDDEGRRLSDNEKVLSKQKSGETRGKLNFIPNVEGGRF